MMPPNVPQMVMNMVRGRMGNNPVMKNALQMMEKGDNAGLEQLARNLYKENNLDIDKAIEQVKGQFGLK